jgi:hypothetical protein
MAMAFVGSLVWSLEGAPAGRTSIALTAVAAGLTLGLAVWHGTTEDSAGSIGLRLADNFSSAALLGTAITAMLVGHSYLIAPAMSLQPLLRLLAALFVALLVRVALAGGGFWFWTTEHATFNLTDELLLWLPVRWLVGLAVPLILSWMAWEAAKIRSTQSATGILYVVVVLSFLGELTSQLLFNKVGHSL